MNTNWGTCQNTGKSCNLNFLIPSLFTDFAPPANCYQGNVPNKYIDVRQYTDVVAALTFSNTTGVPLVIKNSGHDYKGRSSGPNSLMLWTHNLQGITLTRGFVAAGCSADSAKDGVTFGAGIGFLQLYQFAEVCFSNPYDRIYFQSNFLRTGK